MAEYQQDREALVKDLAACCLAQCERKGWRYPPDACERARAFALHWVCWEELFAGMPESPIAVAVRRMARERWGAEVTGRGSMSADDIGWASR